MLEQRYLPAVSVAAAAVTVGAIAAEIAIGLLPGAEPRPLVARSL